MPLGLAGSSRAIGSRAASAARTGTGKVTWLSELTWLIARKLRTSVVNRAIRSAGLSTMLGVVLTMFPSVRPSEKPNVA